MNKQDLKFLINTKLKRMEILQHKKGFSRIGDAEEVDKLNEEIKKLEKEFRKPKKRSKGD